MVPDAFFKAMQTEDQAIAFVMYNREDNENIQRCAMSVDKLEELIGLDLFSELDDASETKLEVSYVLKYWGL